MALETVERLIAIAAPFYKKINFVWHGGEPLLMGLDFYKKVVALQKSAVCRIRNSMQSNLTLMTEELAGFLCENDFAISGSHDGVLNFKSRGRDEEILKGRQMIVSQGKKCGFVMVLSKLNINSLMDSYNYFKKINANYSLNLHIDTNTSSNQSLSLDETETVEKLNNFFAYWARDPNCNINVSYFKHILDFILMGKKTVCTYTSCLGRWIGVRYNGEVVPCNRKFPQEYSFGNIYDFANIGEAFESEGFERILSEAIARREKCKACDIYAFCSGGCNHAAYYGNGIDGPETANCRILKGVYTYIENYLAHTNVCKINNPILLDMLGKQIDA